MDELEFRRRVLANPYELDDELIRFSEKSRARQEFIKSAQSFDKNIREAVAVSIPDDLAVRIILKQTMCRQTPTKHSKPARSNSHKPWYIAGLATLIAIISLAYAIYTYSYHNRLAEHAVAHMMHEPGALQSTQDYTLDDVNAMLSRIGGKIDDLPGEVTYLRYCDFDGEQSVHLVFMSSVGPITVLFIPSQFSAPLSPSSFKFSEQHINGSIYSYANTKQVVMSSNSQRWAKHHSQLSNMLRW